MIKNCSKNLIHPFISKVRIENRAQIAVKGKGTVTIKSCTCIKLVTDVLYVPEIDRNLLSVGQLLEKGYKVIFEDKNCMIKDANGRKLFRIQMKSKCFNLNIQEEEELKLKNMNKKIKKPNPLKTPAIAPN